MIFYNNTKKLMNDAIDDIRNTSAIVKTDIVRNLIEDFTSSNYQDTSYVSSRGQGMTFGAVLTLMLEAAVTPTPNRGFLYLDGLQGEVAQAKVHEILTHYPAFSDNIQGHNLHSMTFKSGSTLYFKQFAAEYYHCIREEREKKICDIKCDRLTIVDTVRIGDDQARSGWRNKNLKKSYGIIGNDREKLAKWLRGGDYNLPTAPIFNKTGEDLSEIKTELDNLINRIIDIKEKL
jgi:hypothetical protein